MKVHAHDAREELIDALGVPAEQVKVKSSEQDELTGIDLMNPFCPVRYIITKDALKEGWDCPFAYLLALLDNTTAATAMTQLIGRVMRQPYARATNRSELDSCYIFCYNQKVKDAVTNVKKGLEQGYLVFGFNFGFRLHKLTFFRNIASTARSYRGKNTHIYKVNMYN